MVMVKVVCGIIYRNDKIFICRRKSTKTLGGFWEFPGGKIENGENNEETLKRELIEELNMKVHIIKYFDTSKYDYNDFSIELIAYICKLKKWDNHLTDHDLYEWIEPTKILKLNLAPADIPLAKKIKDLKEIL